MPIILYHACMRNALVEWSESSGAFVGIKALEINRPS